MGKKSKAEKKRRAVTVELLSRGKRGEPEPGAYRMMAQLIENHHPHLLDANIAIAWRLSKSREDVDGQMEFGRVKRGSDLDRACAPYDFVLVISHEVWNRAESDEKRLYAMLDFLLCSCEVCKDTHGEPVVDEKDRIVWRIRKPVKCFPENVHRFGMWQAESVEDAIKSFNDRTRKLLPDANGHANGDGAALGDVAEKASGSA